MKQLVLESLQTALNAYLALDPATKTHYLGLQGKIVQLEILGIHWTFQLIFTDNKVQITEPLQTADAIIKGTPLSLIHVAFTRENRHRFFTEDVIIQGNAELGQQVLDLFDHIEIDWEEGVSRWIGDAPAHYLGRLVNHFKNWQQATTHTLLDNLREFIHEEIILFPPREAIQDFYVEVDHLRMDVDRLEARINRLTNTLLLKGAK